MRIHVSHVQLTCGINVHGNYYYMVEGSPHVWLTFFGRWRGAVRIHVSHLQLTCGINVHGNYYYMMEGSPHVWLMCGD